MIAIAVSVLAGIYLVIPSILFDRSISFFVPAKKIARSRTDEVLYGLTVAIIPIGIVWVCSHLSYFLGHYPFALPIGDYPRKWADYHNIVLAMISDSYFKDHSGGVWDSVYRAQHHQARFLFWMYIVLGFQVAIWSSLLKNYGRLQRFSLYKRISPFLIGRVSEWHLLLTAFLFHPSEGRIVYVDVVTPEGLYQGKIRNYFTDKDGSLIGVLLDGASRFRLKELNEVRKEWRDKGSPEPKPQTKDFWTKIAGGTHLYIPSSQISNLNVRYEKQVAINEVDILRSMEREKSLRAIIDQLNTDSKKLTVTFTGSALKRQQPLTRAQFNQKAIRTETEGAVFYDVRPFGRQQLAAVALYLGELAFRQSIGALNKSKSVVLIVDKAFQSTPQIDRFIRQLNSAGLRASIEKR